MTSIELRRVTTFNLLIQYPDGLKATDIARLSGMHINLVYSTLFPFRENGTVKISGKRGGHIFTLRPEITELKAACGKCSTVHYVWTLNEGLCRDCRVLPLAHSTSNTPSIWYQLITKPYSAMRFNDDSQST